EQVEQLGKARIVAERRDRPAVPGDAPGDALEVADVRGRQDQAAAARLPLRLEGQEGRRVDEAGGLVVGHARQAHELDDVARIRAVRRERLAPDLEARGRLAEDVGEVVVD